VLSEELGRQLHRWNGTPYVALRFSNIMEPHDYELFPSYWDDPKLRRWNLWGYVDARDVAESCRLALEADVGAEHFIVAAADTVMNRPSRELMAEVFPSVPYTPTAGDFDTLLSTQKARKLLGYEPQWSWRDHIAGS
jgi:nucleoside-diphosphate-sugar epimerase